eukprot:s683_g17.t1
MDQLEGFDHRLRLVAVQLLSQVEVVGARSAQVSDHSSTWPSGPSGPFDKVEEVSQALLQMDLPHEKHLRISNLDVDLRVLEPVVRQDDGRLQQGTLVFVLAPKHLTTSGKPLGSTVARRKQLQALGFECVEISYHEAAQLRSSFCNAMLLHPQAMSVDVLSEYQDDARSHKIPFGISVPTPVITNLLKKSTQEGILMFGESFGSALRCTWGSATRGCLPIRLRLLLLGHSISTCRTSSTAGASSCAAMEVLSKAVHHRWQESVGASPHGRHKAAAAHCQQCSYSSKLAAQHQADAATSSHCLQVPGMRLLLRSGTLLLTLQPGQIKVLLLLLHINRVVNHQDNCKVLATS